MRPDPEAAAAIVTVALAQLQTAMDLTKVAIRLDRGDSPNDDGLRSEPPGGSYLAQREAMLGMNQMEISAQYLRKALKGWTHNVEAHAEEGT